MNLRSALKFIVILAAIGIVAGFTFRQGRINTVKASSDEHTDAARSKAAFSEIAKVFFSPRCANCHSGGDAPTQGDSMTVHAMDVKRGPKGRGTEELSCNMCHQDANGDGEGMPPGVPDWHMPGPEHKMTFQGITAGQLCRNLKDPAQNGGRQSATDSMDHVATDPKVLWSWNPGPGRTLPPLSKDEFMKRMNEWIAGGAACPD
jgi:cytochrome c5